MRGDLEVGVSARRRRQTPTQFGRFLSIFRRASVTLLWRWEGLLAMPAARPRLRRRRRDWRLHSWIPLAGQARWLARGGSSSL